MLKGQLGRCYTVAQEKGERNTGEMLYTSKNKKELSHTHTPQYGTSKYMDIWTTNKILFVLLSVP